VNPPVVKNLGLQPYAAVFQEMQQFTDARNAETTDEIWVLQHSPVYTLGQAGDPAHILNAGEIPVVQSDRGGQVTYHGPGQLVIYPLLDLRRYSMGVRSLVELLENVVILLLSLNVDMNLEPFSRINPCGFAGLEVTQMVDAAMADVASADVAEVHGVESVADRLVEHLVNALVEKQTAKVIA